MSLVLATLLGHWRRHPLQLALIVLGLSLATALWSSVQAINSQAKAAYAEAAATLNQQGFDRLVASDGQIPVATYVRLRRAGWIVSPVLEGTTRVADQRLTVVGVDVFSYPYGARFLTEEGTEAQPPLEALRGQPVVWTHPETAAALRSARPDWQVFARNSLPQGAVFADLSFATQLLKSPEHLTRLLILAAPADPADHALSRLAPTLARIPAGAAIAGDVGELTDSFHLNLTAFGLLSFAVGLFIVQGSITLGVEQRNGLIRTLRLIGASRNDLMRALLIEVLLLSLVAGSIGLVLGYGLAGLLIEDVRLTLAGLYGADIPGGLSLQGSWVMAGLAMSVFGAGLASLQAFWKLHQAASALTSFGRTAPVMRRVGERILALAGALLMAAALGVLWFGGGLMGGFVFLGGLMLGAALVLPLFLQGAVAGLTHVTTAVHWQILLADLRAQLPGFSLSLMALFLAVATNIGVGSMVSSFRLTFVDWLDQRLAADIYVPVRDPQQAAELLAWSDLHAVPVYRAETKLGGVVTTLRSVRPETRQPQSWPLSEGHPKAWQQVFMARAVLVNEQLAQRLDLSLGDQITLAPDHRLEVAGIFADYGNPQGQVLVAEDWLRAAYPSVWPRELGVLTDNPAKTRQQLHARFGIAMEAFVSPEDIRRLSLAVFEKTFVITGALNVLTLGVAGFALFTSFLTQWRHRLPQLAPLWAMGMTRKQLAFLDLKRSLLLAGLTSLAALPLGLAVAWALLRVVNLEAFGWRLPMMVFPGDILRVWIFCALAAVLAAVIPALHLLRAKPATLLGSFSNER